MSELRAGFSSKSVFPPPLVALFSVSDSLRCLLVPEKCARLWQVGQRQSALGTCIQLVSSLLWGREKAVLTPLPVYRVPLIEKLEHRVTDLVICASSS